MQKVKPLSKSKCAKSAKSRYWRVNNENNKIMKSTRDGFMVEVKVATISPKTISHTGNYSVIVETRRGIVVE